MTWFWLLDYVPVVGPVKNALEGVIAVLNGDREGAAEKWIFATVGGGLDFLTLGTRLSNFDLVTLQAGSFLFKLGATRGVQIAAKKCVQIITTQPVLEAGSRKSLLNRGRDRDDNDDRKKKNQDRRHSERGEHVINNNVLKVYRDILRTFVNEVMEDDLDEMIRSGRLSENSSVVRCMNNPIPNDRVANLISDKMIVYSKEHVEENSVRYGQEIKKLRQAVIDFMRNNYDSLLRQIHDRPQRLEKKFRNSVDQFINGKCFVDEQALKLWRPKRGNNSQKFDQAYEEVIKMFGRLKYDGIECMIATWVRELFEARRR